MSFSTIDCVIESFTSGQTPVSSESWVIQVVDPYTLQDSFACDPDGTVLWNFEPSETGMSKAEFDVLWPALMGLMVIGAIFKILRRQMINR